MNIHNTHTHYKTSTKIILEIQGKSYISLTMFWIIEPSYLFRNNQCDFLDLSFYTWY